MQYLKYLALACCLSILISCGKRADKLNYPFVGVWTTENKSLDTRIEIDNKGNGTYSLTDNTGNEVKDNAKARVKKGKNTLTIGFKTWTIDEYPHETTDTSGTTIIKMKLDREYFVRE